MSPAEWIALATAAAAAVGAGFGTAVKVIVAAVKELTGAQRDTTAAQKETTAQITGLREGFAELRGALAILIPPPRSTTPRPDRPFDEERDPDREHTPIRGVPLHRRSNRKDGP